MHESYESSESTESSLAGARVPPHSGAKGVHTVNPLGLLAAALDGTLPHPAHRQPGAC